MFDSDLISPQEPDDNYETIGAHLPTLEKPTKHEDPYQQAYLRAINRRHSYQSRKEPLNPTPAALFGLMIRLKDKSPLVMKPFKENPHNS
jgi:hypothetical protein